MDKNKTKSKEKVPNKKMNRLLIKEKLEAALSELKSLTGEKKFEKGIKKAAKVINSGFSKKSLDSFRKQMAPPVAKKEVSEETRMVIEDLT